MDSKTNLSAGFFSITLLSTSPILSKQLEGYLWVGLTFGCFHEEACKGLVRIPFPDLKSATAASLSAKTCVDDWYQRLQDLKSVPDQLFDVFTRAATVFRQVNEDFLGNLR